jgi:DNA-binding NtrC family response regulator
MKELTIPSDDEKVGSFHDAVQAFKMELVRSALRAHSGNKLKAALELGISRCYLHRLLNQFNLGDENSAEQESDDEDQSGLRQLRESPCEPSRIGVRIA